MTKITVTVSPQFRASKRLGDSPGSSFKGIGQLDEKLAEYAATAERIFSDPDPTLCLTTLRKFGERLARQTAERYDVSLKRR